MEANIRNVCFELLPMMPTVGKAPVRERSAETNHQAENKTGREHEFEGKMKHDGFLFESLDRIRGLDRMK